jgi:hypothetical protein
MRLLLIPVRPLPPLGARAGGQRPRIGAYGWTS